MFRIQILSMLAFDEPVRGEEEVVCGREVM